MDLSADTTANDALHLTGVGENWLLHHNNKQRWYYFSSMDIDDLIVFRNTDSKGKLSRTYTPLHLLISCSVLLIVVVSVIGCFHAAVCHPAAEGLPRESVEVRLVAYRS